MSVAFPEPLDEYENPLISFPTYSESCKVKDLTPSTVASPFPPTAITLPFFWKLIPSFKMPFSMPPIAVFASPLLFVFTLPLESVLTILLLLRLCPVTFAAFHELNTLHPFRISNSPPPLYLRLIGLTSTSSTTCLTIRTG